MCIGQQLTPWGTLYRQDLKIVVECSFQGVDRYTQPAQGSKLCPQQGWKLLQTVCKIKEDWHSSTRQDFTDDRKKSYQYCYCTNQCIWKDQVNNFAAGAVTYSVTGEILSNPPPKVREERHFGSCDTLQQNSSMRKRGGLSEIKMNPSITNHKTHETNKSIAR